MTEEVEPTVAAFAIAAPGLEPIVAGELQGLGIQATLDAGGVAWTGSMDSVARANLWLRSASRVLVRVAEFRARTFWELERHARKVPWGRFVAPHGAVRFRVTSRKSRLYHTEAIAQRLAAAAVARTGATAVDLTPSADRSAGTSDDESGYDDHDIGSQLFVVRVVRDLCTISADSSGALLHRRGYRQAVAKAPLRETIAAAMLLESEWRGKTPLIDPMCGSGTIPIEAALLARRIAPGIGRPFAFERWPEVDQEGWAKIRDGARGRQLTRAPAPIIGSDRDQGAIESARANAERAGVSADVEFLVRPVSAIEPIGRRGWVLTNPPYGVRVGESGAVRDLYAALGNVLRAKFEGWMVGVLSPGGPVDQQFGVALRERFTTSNGGIPVRLMTGEVPP